MRKNEENMTKKSTFLTEKSTKLCTKNGAQQQENTSENSVLKCKKSVSDCTNNEPKNSTEKCINSAAEEGRKSYQKNTVCVPKNSLCWNCKRACTDRLHQCSWSSEFKPVKGWTAEPFVIREGTKRPLPTYHVKACPQFIKRDKFNGEISKAIAFLSDYFHKTGVTIYSHLEEYIDRYEAETGEKFPTWVLWVKLDKSWQRKESFE